jgi:outer membrane autotransporter protein
LLVVGSETVSVSGQVYTGQGQWKGGSGRWSEFGKWRYEVGHYGGTPGVDGVLSAGKDTAWFEGGAESSAQVLLEGKTVELKSVGFGGVKGYRVVGGEGGKVRLSGEGSGMSVVGGGAHEVGAEVELSNGLRLDIGSGSRLTLSGRVSGVGDLVKVGGGVATLLGENVYGGRTLVEEGTLEIGNGGANVGGSVGLGSVEVKAGATLRFNRTDRAVVVDNVISGDGLVEVLGTVTLTNNNTFRGEFNVGPGTGGSGSGGGGGGGKVVLGGADPFGRSVVTLNGSVVEVATGVTELKVNNPIKLTGENTVTMGATSTLALGGQLSGVGAVVKEGEGKLTLTNGSNSYSGGTLVRGGVLEVTNGASVGTGQLVLDGGARFEVNRTLSLDVPVVVRSGEVYVGGTAEKKEVLTMERAVSQGVSDVFVKSGVGILELKSEESVLRGVTLISGGTLVSTQAAVLGVSREIVVGTRGSEGAKLDVSKLPGGLVLKPTQTMKGRGVVSGRIVLGGSMRPGNSVDVLTVDGRELEDFGTNREVLRVQAGARLETEFSLYGLDGELAGVEPVDKLVLIGALGFEGGKAGVVEVSPYVGEGADRSKGIGLMDLRERTVNIIESTDALAAGAEFAQVVSKSPLVTARLGYVNEEGGGSRVTLTLQMKDLSGAKSALGITGGNRAAVLKGLYHGAAKLYAEGGVGGGSGAVSEERLRLMSRAMEPLLMAGGVGAASAVLDRTASTSGYGDLVAVSTKRTMNLGYALDARFNGLLQGGGALGVEEGKWSVWSNGYGLTNWMSGDGQGYAGYRSQGWGDMMGMERREGGLVLGIVNAGGMTRTYLGGGLGRASTSSWHFGVYGSAVADNGLMVSWAGMWGIADTTMRRVMGTEQVSARFDSREWLAQVGVGMDVAGGAGGWSVIPSVRVIGSGYMAPQVKESGGEGAARVGAMSESTVMTKAGIEVSKSGKVKEIPLRFSATVDYVRDFSADPRRATSRLNGATDVVWDSMSARRKENGVKVGAAVEARLSASKSVRLYGEQEMGARDNVTRYGVSFSIEF